MQPDELSNRHRSCAAFFNRLHLAYLLVHSVRSLRRSRACNIALLESIDSILIDCLLRTCATCRLHRNLGLKMFSPTTFIWNFSPRAATQILCIPRHVTSLSVDGNSQNCKRDESAVLLCRVAWFLAVQPSIAPLITLPHCVTDLRKTLSAGRPPLLSIAGGVTAGTYGC